MSSEPCRIIPSIAKIHLISNSKRVNRLSHRWETALATCILNIFAFPWGQSPSSCCRQHILLWCHLTCLMVSFKNGKQDRRASHIVYSHYHCVYETHRMGTVQGISFLEGSNVMFAFLMPINNHGRLAGHDARQMLAIV
jgi:hypothetical protein